jgi:hypothetical protein
MLCWCCFHDFCFSVHEISISFYCWNAALRGANNQILEHIQSVRCFFLPFRFKALHTLRTWGQIRHSQPQLGIVMGSKWFCCVCVHFYFRVSRFVMCFVVKYRLLACFAPNGGLFFSFLGSILTLFITGDSFVWHVAIIGSLAWYRWQVLSCPTKEIVLT